MIREGAILASAPEHVISALEAVRGREPWPPRAEEEQHAADQEPLWDELDFENETSAPLVFKEDSPAERVTGKPPNDGSESGGRRGSVEKPDDANTSADDATGILVALMGPSPIAVDDLVRLSRFSPRLVQTILLDLELAGQIERHGGRRVSLSLPSTE